MRRVLPAVGLFIGAPLIAEYLMGNLPITALGTLVVLAPLYGGGALLIRETVRRARRGWPSIFVLALAYGVMEEGLIMQSLFNPNFMGLQQHLLRPAYLPALGMSAWWTIFVLTLHTVWSIPVSIVMAESLAPEPAGEPWLKERGMALVAFLFVVACFCIAKFTVQNDPIHFVASAGQLACAAMAVLALIAAAFRLPHSRSAPDLRPAPRCSIAAALVFAAGSAFLLIPAGWGWWAVCLYVALDCAMIWMIGCWSAGTGWGSRHRLAIGAGAAMVYAWHAFVEVPAGGRPNRIGNAVFAFGLIVVIWTAARKVRRRKDMELAEVR
jgi:hypothetical protein